jgi:hypothetical protein
MSPIRFPSEEPVDLKYKFEDKLQDEDIKKSMTNTPLFCYDYIDLETTDYHFNQECLDGVDARSYFQQVKKFSQIPLNDLINQSNYKDHFRVYNTPGRKIKELLEKISGKATLLPEQIPSLGEFALYTDQDRKADRETGVKSPRIHFFIGEHGIIYILFFDPYHEIFNKKG